MNNISNNIVEIKDLKELQKKLTDLALELGRYYKIDLNFTDESVKKVEEILSKISEDYHKTKNEEGINGMALELAAYIVTVIEKNIIGGKWERDSKDFGKNTFPYDLGNENIIFPYAWCLKRIHDGESENVWLKFNALVLDKK